MSSCLRKKVEGAVFPLLVEAMENGVDDAGVPMQGLLEQAVEELVLWAPAMEMKMGRSSAPAQR